MRGDSKNQFQTPGAVETVKKASVLPAPMFLDEPESDMHVILPAPKIKVSSQAGSSKNEENNEANTSSNGLKMPDSKNLLKDDKDKKVKRKSEARRGSVDIKNQNVVKNQNTAKKQQTAPDQSLLKTSEAVKSKTSSLSQNKARKSLLDTSEKAHASRSHSKTRASKSTSKQSTSHLKQADRVVSDIAYVPEMQYNIRLTDGDIPELVVEENIFTTSFGGNNLLEHDKRDLPAADPSYVSKEADKKSSNISRQTSKKDSKSGQTPSRNSMKRKSKLGQSGAEINTKKDGVKANKVNDRERSKTIVEDKTKINNRKSLNKTQNKNNEENDDRTQIAETEEKAKHNFLKKSDKGTKIYF